MNIVLFISVACVVAGFIAATWLKTKSVKDKIIHAEEEARRILDEARHRSETLTKEAQLEAKDVIFQMKSDFDIRDKRNPGRSQEKRKMADSKRREYRS